jgi:hypothetical protein
MMFASKDPCSTEDASGQNCEVTETNTWSDAAEGIYTRRVIRHARTSVIALILPTASC